MIRRLTRLRHLRPEQVPWEAGHRRRLIAAAAPMVPAKRPIFTRPMPPRVPVPGPRTTTIKQLGTAAQTHRQRQPAGHRPQSVPVALMSGTIGIKWMGSVRRRKRTFPTPQAQVAAPVPLPAAVGRIPTVRHPIPARPRLHRIRGPRPFPLATPTAA